jgi:proteasome lid subunit RPN8/RPN11
MLDDVQNRLSEEACGLVAGEGKTSAAVIPLANDLHSRLRYRLDPHEQFEAFKKIDENGWVLLAIYHSHLESYPRPSPTDVAEATYPETIYLIWSNIEGRWECRGYQITEGNYQEIRVDVIDDD